MTEPTQSSRTPLISVIMPAYNAAPYIRESVATVLEQDHSNIELIVVDDGSSDGTPELLEGLDPRVSVLRQKNAGPAAARNLGLKTAKGEFIAFLDADDLWTPRKLSRQLAFLQSHPEYGMVFGGFLRWYAKPDGSFDPPPPALGAEAPADALVEAQSGWIYVPLLFDNIVHIITALVRREVIDAVGFFDATLATGEDYNYWLRVSRCFQAAKMERTLAFYRMHKASITQKPRPENNELRVLQGALNQWGLRCSSGRQADEARIEERLFTLNFSHGYQHIRLGSARVAAQDFLQALRLRPSHLKSWAYLLVCGVKQLVRS